MILFIILYYYTYLYGYTTCVYESRCKTVIAFDYYSLLARAQRYTVRDTITITYNILYCGVFFFKFFFAFPDDANSPRRTWTNTAAAGPHHTRPTRQWFRVVYTHTQTVFIIIIINCYYYITFAFWVWHENRNRTSYTAGIIL